jgi:oligoribonuclease NrnB/cAMP/cGMP phosphodiesterase (DHH superfamily)
MTEHGFLRGLIGMFGFRIREDAEKRNSRLIASLVSRKSPVVHLTHNDLDAVGSDAIHRMKYGEILTIFSSVGRLTGYLDLLSRVPGNGNLLSVSDLGSQPRVPGLLKAIRAQGWQVEWRDHHRWSEDEMAAVAKQATLLRVDTNVCACGICARDLMPGDEVASTVSRVVCDYDLWKHEDPRSAVLGQVLQKGRNRDYVRDYLIRGVFSDPYIESEYARISGERDRMIRKSLRKTWVLGNRYRVVFAPLYGYPSETAAAIRKSFGSEIEVIVSGTGRFSIRSVPPISHLIAREFRGGGHPNAAGGSFEFSLVDRLRFTLFHRTPSFRELVSFTDSME